MIAGRFFRPELQTTPASKVPNDANSVLLNRGPDGSLFAVRDVAQTRKIVVIDSEPTVRTVIKTILEREGYSVRATEDFRAATEMIREAKPNLVMTNVFLQGIPGHEAMQILRRDFPGLPILMVSGLPDDCIIERWMGEAHFDMFPKPFTQSALVRKVAEMLEQNSDSDQ